MNSVFTDGETLSVAVSAELLTLCNAGHYFTTPKIPTEYKNFYYWLQVYPNGDFPSGEEVVDVYIFASIGGFDVEFTFTIDHSNVEVSAGYYLDEPFKFGVPKLTTHEELRSGGMIQDGEFVIRCKIKFRITSPTILEIPDIIEEKRVIKLRQHDIETFKAGQNIVTDKQTVRDITWYYECYPCGYSDENNGYVSIFLHFEGRPITLELSFALSIGGVLIYVTFSHTFEEEVTYFGLTQIVSPELRKRTDQTNGAIELLCIVGFDRPPRSTIPIAMSVHLMKQFLLETRGWKDSDTLFVNTDLLSLEPGCYIESEKRWTHCQDLFWCIRCYPNGRFEADKGHIGVFIYTSIDGFEISYALAVDGSNVKTFCGYFIYEDFDPLDHGSPRLVSHEKIKTDGLIENGTIGIQCLATFKLNDDMLSNGQAIENEIIEDSCIFKLDRKAFESGKRINDEIQNGSGTSEIKWSVKCCPYGEKYQDEAYVSVSFYVESLRAIKKLETSCALSIGGVLIHKSGFPTNDGIEYTYNFPKLFSHKQCLLADHKNDVIDLVCKVRFSKPEYYEFEDSETLVIKADWLNLFESENCIITSPRPVPRCENLYWWIKCYPNGYDEDWKQNVSAFVMTSVGGFKLGKTITVLRTYVERHSTEFRSRATGFGFGDIVSHDKLREDDTIQNGEFTIVFDVKFEIPISTIDYFKTLESFEDSYTIKFDLKLIDTYNPDQEIIVEAQKIGGIG